MKSPLLLRALLVAGVAILVLFPIHLIEGKISERRARAESVVTEFAAETSGSQTIAGPFLALTCEETYSEERQVMRAGKAETISETKTGPCATAYFSPRSLKAAAKMPVEDRHRGIYPIRLYRAFIEMSGELEWPQPPVAYGSKKRVWKNVYLVMAVSDPRGIKAANSSTSTALTQAKDEDFQARFAFREDLGPYVASKAGSTVPFAYQMEIIGTSSLAIAPTGDATDIRLTSNWPHPSFGGAWSPDERSISREGFEARWRTTHLATGGQAAWDKLARDGKLLADGNAAGVSLVDPINVYSLSYRATEYAFLFVLFTFGALALAEATTDVRLHAVQYALVGAALAVFFLLLIALSEHIRFAVAYASASAACIALLTFYLRHPLGTRGRAAAFFVLFSGLYSALYMLLKSEDHALLMGSLMVFAVLAVAMIATRKQDWSTTFRPSISAFGRPAGDGAAHPV